MVGLYSRALNLLALLLVSLTWFSVLEVSADENVVSLLVTDENGEDIPSRPLNAGMQVIVTRVEAIDGDNQDGNSTFYYLGENGSVAIPVSDFSEAGKYHIRVYPYNSGDTGRVGVKHIEISPDDPPNTISVTTKEVHERVVTVLKNDHVHYRITWADPSAIQFPPRVFQENGGDLRIEGYEGQQYRIKARWLYPVSKWTDAGIFTVPQGEGPVEHTVDAQRPWMIRVRLQVDEDQLAAVASRRVLLREKESGVSVGMPLDRMPDQPHVWAMCSSYLPDTHNDLVVTLHGLRDPSDPRLPMSVAVDLDERAPGEDLTLPVSLRPAFTVQVSSPVDDREVSVIFVNEENKIVESIRLSGDNLRSTADVPLISGKYVMHAHAIGYRPFVHHFSVEDSDKNIHVNFSSEGMQEMPYDGKFEIEIYDSIAGTVRQVLSMDSDNLAQYGTMVIPHPEDKVYLVMSTMSEVALLRPGEVVGFFQREKLDNIKLFVKNDDDMQGLLKGQDRIPNRRVSLRVVDVRQPSVTLWRITHLLDSDGQLDPQTLPLAPGRYRMVKDIMNVGQLRSSEFSVGTEQKDIEVDLKFIALDGESP